MERDFRGEGSSVQIGQDGYPGRWRDTPQTQGVWNITFYTFPKSGSTADRKSSFQRRFFKEVVLWKSLNHPNILGLIGVCRWTDSPDSRLTMVSEWMANGNIIDFIKYNESQRLQLVCGNGS